MVGPAALVEVEYERGTAARRGAVSRLARPRRGAAGDSADGAALERQGLRRHRREPSDAWSRSWIERLIAPVLTDGFDYVSPYYVRHVNEGAITKGIVYPMFRALYGVRLRQPAASEFGCSGRLVTHYLEQDFWDIEQATVGIDLWLAVAAVVGEFRICEAVLGTRGSAPRVACRPI